ncbi:hypothetical protein N658DRAFT_511291 [Parathielavia hyrcaniae]|uniref:Rhodopsin domain-containing protein n=1 Tax=Parathielavia hyrcaniae TaxID=113614 RepID=A0AAN6PVX9_9PEZI|nr:hypothetical protein N658DRAFT_511291 [Parathielavia hyrcaniae]
MGLKGDAPWALGIMWLLAGLVFFFLVLRLYTRIVCLASYGLDDHVYIVAFVFLLIFTIFTHLAGQYGFGQTMDEIGSMDLAVKATLYECIGQAFAIVGMAIAKASLGFFLLRLVTIPWHRIAIRSAMLLVMLASIAQVLCFWLSCVPLNFVYDRRIPGGYCPIDTRPTSYILCVSTVLVDFFFAIFPWIIVWPLQMPQREKYTIAGSMSLGLIAAAAGIKRTTEVEGLYTANYLKDSVGLIVWSSAEMAVTLICIGIPVCRPLYKRAFRLLLGEISSSSQGYQKQSAGPDGNGNNSRSLSVPLRTIGGGLVDADGRPISNVQGQSAARKGGGTNKNAGGRDMDTAVDGLDDDDKNTGSGSGDDAISFSEVKLGVNGPFTRTTVGRGRSGSSSAGDGGGGGGGGDNNASDEEILDEYRRRSQVRSGRRSDDERTTRPGHGNHGIMVTETIRVERS